MHEWISWFATAATVTAALITASNLGSRITGYGFVVFLAGSLAWLATAIVTAQPALLWTNAILTGLNMFGIWRWLGRQTRIEKGAESAEAASRHTPGEALFPASMLSGGQIVDREGVAIGQSVDAMVGARTGRIHYLVASAGGIAGVGERLHRVDRHDVLFEEDRISLAMSRAEFQRLPVLPRGDWTA